MPDTGASNGNGETRGDVKVLQAQYAGIQQTLQRIEATLNTQCERWNDDHDHIVRLEGELQRLRDKQAVWQVSQGALAALLSALAAWLGMRQP